uniref:THAP domain-containing protein 1 n=1 Tax=Salmo trutta TaxID=8032 RepID=A0A674ANK0_SALTR
TRSSSWNIALFRCVPPQRNTPRLSFHSFPSNTELRAKWGINIRREKFPITSHSKICDRHFLPHDFIEPCGLRRLKKGAVPLLFQWNNRARASVWERRERPRTGCVEDNHVEDGEDEEMDC